MAIYSHVIVRREVTWGTWNTPNVALPMEVSSVDQGQETIEPLVTGRGRGLYQRIMGARNPSGKLNMPFYGESMGWLLAAMGFYDIATTTPAGATTARLHGFLPLDTANPASLSLQNQYTSSIAQNVKGLVISKGTITVANKGLINLAADWIAEDETRSGGTWSDGSAAPAVIASPTYFAGTILPFTAFDVAISIDGTPALDDPSNVISVTGATAHTRLESLEVSIENNMSAVHLLNGRRNPGAVWGGARKVMLTFDRDWTDNDTTFYDRLRTGGTFALQIVVTGAQIESGQFRELRIILPCAAVNSGPLPEISGSLDRPVMSLELVCMVDPVTNQDINIVLKDTQTSYAAA